jgi:hypothetical protein
MKWRQVKTKCGVNGRRRKREREKHIIGSDISIKSLKRKT